MKFFSLACALVGVVAADAQVGLQVIRLNDNSVIQAQVSEMAGGFYIAKSPTLGELKIPAGSVLSIKNVEPPARIGEEPGSDLKKEKLPDSAPAQVPSSQAGVEALRSAVASKVQDLAATSGGMATIEKFSQNQDVKAILDDPSTLNSIQSGDYNALMKSPAMKKLMDNPQTKSLIQSVLSPDRHPVPAPTTSSNQEMPR